VAPVRVAGEVAVALVEVVEGEGEKGPLELDEDDHEGDDGDDTRAYDGDGDHGGDGAHTPPLRQNDGGGALACVADPL